MITQKRKFAIIAIAHIIALALLILALKILPHIVSECSFRKITGIPCPGCGLTRAAFSLLHFDFAKAWYYNPSIFFLPVAVILAIDLPLFKNKKPVLILISLLFTSTLVTYFVRLLFFTIP